MSLSFTEKLQSDYYSSAAGLHYVSAREARNDGQKNYQRNRYLEAEARLQDEFKVDAFEELGITDNPKRDLLYSKAYEQGHSNGYNEIYNVMSDLVDLIL